MKLIQEEWKKYSVSQLGIDLKSTFIVKAGECEIIINKPLSNSRATQEEAEAIAKLIEATPELLKEHLSDIPLLEEAIQLMKRSDEGIEHAIAHIRTVLVSKGRAIKKATD